MMSDLGCTDAVPSTVPQSVQRRAVAFERHYQQMRQQAPAARRYPTIWPRYVAAMRAADLTRQQLRSGAAFADDVQHYRRELAEHGVASEGLGWVWIPWTLGVGVLGLLGKRHYDLATVKACIERAEQLSREDPSLSPAEAEKLACPERHDTTWAESLPRVAMWGAIGIGGIYLLHTFNARSKRTEGRRRRARLRRLA